MFERTDVGVPTIRPREFALIRDFARSTFGLDLHPGKACLVSARLGKHLRAGGFRSFEDYFRHVQRDATGQSLIALINALTTNHTSFLREPDHFQFLTGSVLSELRPRSSIRIWSAACSTGEEVYSLLFSVLDAVGASRNPQLRITGTDISTKVLDIARAGVYAADRLSGLPQTWLQRFFRKTAPDRYTVRQEYQAMVEFQRLNLMDDIPSGFRFPAIFCRNVMIYFNAATQARLVQRLSEQLEPGGYLFVGHAESLTGLDHGLRYVRPAVYQKAK